MILADLERAANTLTEPTRTVTLLHLRHDWSYQEIATGRGPGGEQRSCGFGGMVDSTSVGTFVRLGTQQMIAALVRGQL